MAHGDTRYSDFIEGDRGNYDWPVRFDVTDGYIGITQLDDAHKVKHRVLLSPAQYRALTRFATLGRLARAAGKRDAAR